MVRLKYTEGTKVVPINKSVPGYDTLEDSNVWCEAQSRGMQFLYVNGWDEEEGAYYCNYKLDDSGDFFMESDLIPYQP